MRHLEVSSCNFRLDVYEIQLTEICSVVCE